MSCDRETAHMRPELEALRLEAVTDPTAVDRFVDGRSFPLIDDGTSTFVYRGEADAVRLRHWVYGLAATPTFTRLDGTDLWYLVLDVPRDSRVEYKIEVIRGDHVESIQDPLNPHTARDPFGANSVLQTDGLRRGRRGRSPTPRRAPAPWSPTAATARRSGATSTSTSTCRRGSARPAATRCSIVHDGGDYLDYSSMQVVLDNLIHRLELAEIVVAFTNPQDRLVEYADDEPPRALHRRGARALAGDRVPARRHTRRTRPDGRELRRRGVVRVARRHPGIFGRLLLQSGSFAFTDIGAERARPAVRPDRGDRQRLPRRPATVQRAGLRQLRHATSR